MSSFEIREAMPGDGAGMISVVRQSNLETYPNPAAGITYDDIDLHFNPPIESVPESIEVVDQSLALGNDSIGMWVAVAGDEIIGTLNAIKKPSAAEYTVHLLYVLKPFLGMGIGPQLMDAANEWFGTDKPIGLKVVRYNERAIRFYQRQGFVINSSRPNEKHKLRNGKHLPLWHMVRTA